jgi:hypothetical protein
MVFTVFGSMDDSQLRKKPQLELGSVVRQQIAAHHN